MLLSLCFMLQSLVFPWTTNADYEMSPVEKLNTKINSSKYDEINPVISKDGLTIYFTRVGHPDFNRTLMDENLDLSTSLSFNDYQNELSNIYQTLSGKKVNSVTDNAFNQDVWVATWSNGDFNNIQHPDYPLNSALPNSVCSLTPNNNELIVINEFYKDGSMYKGFSTIKHVGDNNWQFPRPLFIYDYYSLSPDVNLTMSEDGRVIIMSLNRQSSLGSNDLYVSFKVDDNLFTSPLPLSSKINSIYRETTPFISRDGQFIYFSSNKPDGYGGNDIYVARRLDDTWQNWSEPSLLPAPINSVYDDSQPFVNEFTGYIYFTSKRDGTSDIFRSAFHPMKENERKKTLIIRVVNSLTGQPINGEVVYGKLSDGFYTQTLNTIDGTIYYSFTDEDDIMIKAKKSGYTGVNKDIRLSELYKDEITMQEITLYLEPKDKEEKFTLNNIYFIQSTAIIKDESYESLDLITQVLNKNAALKMKISGHTDNVGEEQSLIQLSLERATAIKDYLVKKGGIDPKRIIAEGKGRSEPLNDNSTEEKKSKNRRVEFTVYK